MSDQKADQYRAQELGRRILPKDTDDLIKSTWEKHAKARDLLSRLKVHPDIQGREDVHKAIDDLSSKHQQAGELLQKLRHAAEYRHELKRMALGPEQVVALIPHKSTPFGQSPLFVIGLVDREGHHHLFQRPIRTAQ